MSSRSLRRYTRPFHLFVYAIVLATSLAVGLTAHHKASADVCGDLSGVGGISCYTGYFEGRFSNYGDNVLSQGVPNYVDTAEEFKYYIGTKMLCTAVGPGSGGFIPPNLYRTQDATGAAFIVMTMLGYPSRTFKNTACDQWLRWCDLVDQYDRAHMIIWHKTEFFRGNTYWMPGVQDDGFEGPASATYQGVSDLLIFVSKDRQAYSLRRECANPVGKLTALTDKKHPPSGYISTASCTDRFVRGRAKDIDSFDAVPLTITISSPNHATEVINWRTDYQGDINNGGDANPNTDYAFYWSMPDWAWNSTQAVTVNVTATNIPVPSSPGTVNLGSKTFGPCIKLQPTCDSVSVQPPALDPNTQYTITANLHYDNVSGFGRALNVVGDAIDQAGSTSYIRVIKPNGQPDPPTNKPIASRIRTGTAITLKTQQLQPTNDTGTFSVHWGAEGGGAAASCPFGVDGNGNQFDVVDRPYFNVTGGDVSAGAGMSTPTSGSDCSTGDGTDPNPKAGLVSWNRQATGNYAGAGTAYGALALNYIQDFATAQNTAGPSANDRPDGLSFANVTAAGNQFDVATGMFGGSFGANSCTPNFFDGSNAKTGTYQVNTGGSKLLLDKNSSRDTIYVEGNAVISNDIIYTNSGNYANIGEIPNFSLVVRGNIFIDAAVTQIDGILVAQPKADGTGGVIYTCAPNGTSSPVLDKNLYSKCGARPLVFNGAVVAKQLWLLRTYGTITEGPAEQFNFTPEVWLKTPFTSNNSGNAGSYDAISSLPPVL